MSEVYFKYPGLGGRRVVIRGFKLDDGDLRCWNIITATAQRIRIGSMIRIAVMVFRFFM